MLSAIGRAALRRAGLGGSRSSTCRVTQSIQRVNLTHDSTFISSSGPEFDFVVRSLSKRSYATEAAPAAAVAAKPRAKRTAAKKAAKKPVKRVTKKKATKKVAKRKPAAKKKVAKKPKAAKKVLTPEQAEKKKLKREKDKLSAEIAMLKETALLDAPTVPAFVKFSAWKVVLAEHTRNLKGSKQPLGTTAKSAASQYKTLTGSEREHYNHIANQEAAAAEVAYKKWVESHTPVQIYDANKARAKLRRLKARLPTNKTRPIKDARMPERGAVTGLPIFIKERFDSGDMKGMTGREGLATLVAEWKALPVSQKQPYEDTVAAQKQRYLDEFRTVYKREPPGASASASP